MRPYFIIFAVLSLLLCRSVSSQILVENFRSVGCTNCIDPDKKFEGFVTSNPQYKINLVYLHNDVATKNGDPFYDLSKSDVMARENLYQPIGDPYVFIVGFDAGQGQNESNWEALSKDPASANYSGTLTATASIGAGDTIHIALHASGTSNGVQVKPYVMLVESGIKFANSDSYGNPQDSIWNNIFRAMIPGSQGGTAFTLSGSQDFHYTYAASSKPWNLDNCKIYAFLQEVPKSTGNSHPIDAFTVASITTSAVKTNGGDIATSLSAPIPNPAQSFVRIPFHIANPTNVKIIICDNLGREVGTVKDQYVSETESSAIFTPDHILTGIYYARMYVNGTYIGSQKIVFVP